MHQPPKLEVLTRLKNSSLEVVSFGIYVVHLVFENGNRLSVSAPFRFGNEDAIYDTSVCEFPLCETNLVRALGQCIIEVDCDADGTLDLVFSNQDRLIVYANDPMYEAYTLLVNGQEYVV